MLDALYVSLALVTKQAPDWYAVINWKQ